ncbi:unnamed protein product [Parnassius apollo]|uniref:(apollo) hypothetical protein n=1 Tax=Parnassius apollo TaxID=110799 RepID=A0A8S3XSB2_PARAO|nr:unnamed protein product [Parnassius apollo]
MVAAYSESVVLQRVRGVRDRRGRRRALHGAQVVVDLLVVDTRAVARVLTNVADARRARAAAEHARSHHTSHTHNSITP